MQEESGLKNRYKTFLKRIDDYKTTPQYKRDVYYNKMRLKLTLTVFPSLIIILFLARKFAHIEGHTLVFILMMLGILAINFGAEILTRKKFDKIK